MMSFIIITIKNNDRTMNKYTEDSSLSPGVTNGHFFAPWDNI